MADVRDEWIDMIDEEIQEVRSLGVLSKDEHLWLMELEKKKHSLETKGERATEKNVKKMLSKIGSRIGIPSRAANLTPKMEKDRCQLTWQQFDERCHLACFGEKEELKDYVADVATFQKMRKDTSLVFSDEIPLWIKIGLLKTIFADWEMEADARTKRARTERNAKRGQASQKLDTDEAPQGEMAEGGEMGSNEGCTQRRGAERVGEKCRITFEARQMITGYFSGKADEIKGHILPSAIIVKCSGWANLQNIKDDYTFKATQRFMVGDHEILHEEGKKTTLMRSYVDLRKKKPDLFKDILVYGQPSAWLDEITNAWLIEDLGERCSQCIHQRDLFGVMLTQSSRKKMRLYSHVPSWIGAKMTPVLQITDTDFAFIMKAAAERRKRHGQRYA